MSIRVLNDNLLVIPKELDYSYQEGFSKEVVDALKSGKLALPETAEMAAKKFGRYGKVVSWGDKCRYKYKVGQEVYFGPHATFNKIIIEDTAHYFVKEWDLLAEVEDA